MPGKTKEARKADALKAIEEIRALKALKKVWHRNNQLSVYGDKAVYRVFAYVAEAHLNYKIYLAFSEAMEDWLDKHAPRECWPIKPAKQRSSANNTR